MQTAFSTLNPFNHNSPTSYEIREFFYQIFGSYAVYPTYRITHRRVGPDGGSSIYRITFQTPTSPTPQGKKLLQADYLNLKIDPLTLASLSSELYRLLPAKTRDYPNKLIPKTEIAANIQRELLRLYHRFQAEIDFIGSFVDYCVRVANGQRNVGDPQANPQFCSPAFHQLINHVIKLCLLTEMGDSILPSAIELFPYSQPHPQFALGQNAHSGPNNNNSNNNNDGDDMPIPKLEMVDNDDTSDDDKPSQPQQRRYQQPSSSSSKKPKARRSAQRPRPQIQKPSRSNMDDDETDLGTDSDDDIPAFLPQKKVVVKKSSKSSSSKSSQSSSSTKKKFSRAAASPSVKRAQSKSVVILQRSNGSDSGNEWDDNGDDDGNTWEIEKLLDFRLVRGQVQFSVKWVGYSRPTWEKMANMCSEWARHDVRELLENRGRPDLVRKLGVGDCYYEPDENNSGQDDDNSSDDDQ